MMRQAILKAASRQIKNGGYLALNFGAIAAELRTTRANIHYHFKNKESLALAVILDYKDFSKKQHDALVKTCGGDFKKLIREMEKGLKSQLADGGGACPCSALMTTSSNIPDELTRISVSHVNSLIEFFEEQIKQSIKNGVIKNRRRKPRDIAREGAMLAFAAMQLYRSYPGEPDGASIYSGALSKWAATL